MRWGLRARAAAAAGESRSYVISVWDDDERGGERRWVGVLSWLIEETRGEST